MENLERVRVLKPTILDAEEVTCKIKLCKNGNIICSKEVIFINFCYA